MTTMDREAKERHGLRILFMILFWFILRLSYFITGLLGLVQWIWRWFETRTDGRIRRFSVSLARYQRQVVDYLVFNTAHKPFPFDDWPSGDDAVSQPEDEVDEDEPRAESDTVSEAPTDDERRD